MSALFNSLTGRMVATTVAALALSYFASFLLFANERGAALRRVTETAAAESIANLAERLRAAPAADRAAQIAATRDFGVRYSLARAPSVAAPEGDGAAMRLTQLLKQRLGDIDIRAAAATFAAPRGFRRHVRGDAGRPPGGPPDDFFLRIPAPPPELHDGEVETITEVRVSLPLDAGDWLNARARLPGPHPPPVSLIISVLASMAAVGAAAAFASRQIGRPLAELATAARALGSGEVNAAAPVSGPDDVRRAALAFNSMAERLGRQLQRQRQMLWALSHDLRTPITALRLRAELIDDEAARERLLAPIADMERLTVEALALARAGVSDEPRARVDLAEIARTLCGELYDMGLAIAADAPETVLASCRPNEIARALRNLAENAARHGGGGVMRVSRDQAGEAVVEVLDDGPGVPEEVLHRLAEPFFRADAARATSEGAGLGLAIAQAIAEAHGGKLVLRNRAPRGFSASLALPGA